MSQANVYTTVANATWYTDRVSISTGATAVTYNVYQMALNAINPANGNPIVAQAAAGNIFAGNPAVPANAVKTVYVGAGNKLTITGANFTAQEIGTATSATAGAIGVGSA